MLSILLLLCAASLAFETEPHTAPGRKERLLDPRRAFARPQTDASNASEPASVHPAPSNETASSSVALNSFSVNERNTFLFFAIYIAGVVFLLAVLIFLIVFFLFLCRPRRSKENDAFNLE